MANKTGAARQFGKPSNPVAVLARQRAAGPHAKPHASERQAAKRALKKAKLVADED